MKYYSLRILPVILLLVLWFGVTSYWEKADTVALQLVDRNWPTYGGNQAGNRYSPLTQINLQNVKNLQLAWTYETGDMGKNECQPIVVKGILYGVSARMKLFALDPATGKELWKFDPFAIPGKKPRSHPVRGVTYWGDGNDKRILYSVGTTLYAISAVTGEQIKTFGEQGEVDLYVGLGGKEVLGYDPRGYSYGNTSPGIIYKNILIIGSNMSEGGNAPPGYIQAFNVRTGKLVWVFHTIPLPGEYGYETWSKDSYRKLGAANAWAGMVVDEKRGMVYASTGSASVDFYGGARIGQNLFANCVIAIDAQTGNRKWHFQTIHHDLWDRDLPCPPNLITVKHNGRMVDAVAQATKDGLIFVFDRDTGVPLFPVKEVPVPTSPSLPGEQPWPTQPVPTKPAPFSMQELTEETITDRTPEARAYVLNRFKNSLTGSKYMPPSIKGNLIFGIGGGAQWGGNAADPNGILYVNSSNMLWWVKMRENPSFQNNGAGVTRGAALFNTNCSPCHGDGKSAGVGDGAQAVLALIDVGKRLTRVQISTLLETGRGRMPSFQHLSENDREAVINYLLKTEVTANANASVATDAKKPDFPYDPPFLSNGTVQFRDQEGYPAMKAPWGTLNAVDLNTGNYLWQVPLGEYPEITKEGLPQTGTENHGGPVVTASGLLFIAATYDEHLRAFDTKTGKVVWEYKLPAGGFSTPITYMKNGKQYVVIAAGGGRLASSTYELKLGSSFVAFALP